MYFYYHINVQKSSQQPIFMSVALLNPRTHWISRPSSSKDVQIKSTCLRLLATSSVLTATSATDAWQKIIIFRFFQRSWWKWEKAYICLVRSNHSRCNSWPLPGRQTPPWLWRRRKRPPRQCSSSPGWISKIRTDGAAGCLSVIMAGRNIHLFVRCWSRLRGAASLVGTTLLGLGTAGRLNGEDVDSPKWNLVCVRLNLNSSGHLIYLDAAGCMRGHLRTYYYLGAAVRNGVATSSRGLLGGLREEHQFFNCYISSLKYLCALVVNHVLIGNRTYPTRKETSWKENQSCWFREGWIDIDVF